LQVCSPKHSPPTPPSYYSLIEIEIGWWCIFKIRIYNKHEWSKTHFMKFVLMSRKSLKIANRNNHPFKFWTGRTNKHMRNLQYKKSLKKLAILEIVS
jgi:hypothetical protein